MLVAILVGLVFAPYLARLIYRDLTAITQSDYFLIERLFGHSYANSFVRIALPESLRASSPMIITLSADLIGLDAALSFLGLALHPPAPGIGQLVRQGLQDVYQGWWILTGAACLLAVIVIDLNRFAFALSRPT